jgi:hypothetical protein
MWAVIEVEDGKMTGTNGSNIFVQGKSAGSGGSTTSPTVALDSAYSNADNLSLSALSYLSSSITATPGSGYTTVASIQGSGTPGGSLYMIQGRDVDLTIDATLSTGSATLFHALEIVGDDLVVLPIVQLTPYRTIRLNGRL